MKLKQALNKFNEISIPVSAYDVRNKNSIP